MALKTLLIGTTALVLAAPRLVADFSVAGAGWLGAFGVASVTAMFLLRAHARSVQTIAQLLFDVERSGDLRPHRTGMPSRARARHEA